MAADGVERERGALVVHGADVAVRHQAQLHERLEAVADTEHQPVALLQKLANRLGHLGRAEERRDELRRAVRLVASREAAGNHDDLTAREWSASSRVLSATASGVRLFTTNTSATAPARSNARAESYSQLLPGTPG